MPGSDEPTGLPTSNGPPVALGQRDFEIEFCGRVLRRNPYHVDALRRQAELLAACARHAEALPLDRRLVELFPRDCAVCYNLACSLAMVGKANEAMETLRRALELGYDDFAYMAADSDLDSLRDFRGFRAMMAGLMSRRQTPP